MKNKTLLYQRGFSLSKEILSTLVIQGAAKLHAVKVEDPNKIKDLGSHH